MQHRVENVTKSPNKILTLFLSSDPKTYGEVWSRGFETRGVRASNQIIAEYDMIEFKRDHKYLVNKPQSTYGNDKTAFKIIDPLPYPPLGWLGAFYESRKDHLIPEHPFD